VYLEFETIATATAMDIGQVVDDDDDGDDGDAEKRTSVEDEGDRERQSDEVCPWT
jgi:hypothetical protein